jgi:hypothetical protein
MQLSHDVKVIPALLWKTFEKYFASRQAIFEIRSSDMASE